MNNVIAFVAPKNKTLAHRMSLNNRISCLVGISIFGFKTYWKRLFSLMEIQTTSTFKQFLKAETLNTKKNKSYYQWYDVKQPRAFHKQAMFKQQIYDNILARWSGVDYSQGIKFETSIINIKEAQEIKTNNQPKESNRSGAGVDPSTAHGLLQRIALWDFQLERTKNQPWGWRYLNPKQRRQQKMQQQRKRANFCRQRPLGRLKNQMREHQQEMWYKIWMLRQWSNGGWVLNGSFSSEETLDRIVSAGLDRIVLAGSGNTGFYALAGYWMDGTDGTDVLDGALVVQGWDGPTLADAGTGAPS